jgi:hypothetical protein
MFEGRCPQCGELYFGLALTNPRYQTCEKCGTALQITDGQKTFKGFSPFTAKNILDDSTENRKACTPEHDPEDISFRQ